MKVWSKTVAEPQPQRATLSKGMPTARIRVDNHIPSLIGLDQAAFADQVEALEQQPARREPKPEPGLLRRSVGAAIALLTDAPNRDELLERLVKQDPARVAREALHRVAGVLPAVRRRIRCHLLPTGGNRGSGCRFGDDRLIVAAPCEGDAASWLRFVITHEYSHTHRAFGEHHADTVREDLVFEGLAMVLAETIFPKLELYPWDAVTAEQEAEFWEGIDPEVRGLEWYLQYMSHDAAYEVGAQVVGAYLLGTVSRLPRRTACRMTNCTGEVGIPCHGRPWTRHPARERSPRLRSSKRLTGSTWEHSFARDPDEDDLTASLPRGKRGGIARAVRSGK